MANVFQLNIYSQEKTVYTGEVVSLIAPAQSGYLGVLAHHAPLIANLMPGKITIKDKEGKEKVVELPSSGFLEVIKNAATILLV